MVFLDSDVLINFLRKDPKTINLFERLRSEEEDLSITSVNSFELLKGVSKSSNMDRSKVMEFLSSFEIYNFEFESSKEAALIFEDLKSKGEMIELPDIMIASIVIANNGKIITGNINHFKRIKNLEVEEL